MHQRDSGTYTCDIVLQSVNARDDAGQTALHKAAMNGWLNCVHLLLDHAVDVNAIDHSGDAAL